MKKTVIAIGAFVLVSQVAQAQWSNDPYSPNYTLEQRHRDADYEFQSQQMERRMQEQQRAMEDLEARQRIQQNRLQDAERCLRYRCW